MLLPKKVKFRKWQTDRRNKKKNPSDTRGIKLAFGSFGLKTESSARITSNQIESARKTIARNLGKTGKSWIRIFPDRPFTKKADQVGMGKGKGDPEGYCVQVLPGRIIFELDGVEESIAREALRKAASKLPIKGKVIARS